jgi:hypothetical protein
MRVSLQKSRTRERGQSSMDGDRLSNASIVVLVGLSLVGCAGEGRDGARSGVRADLADAGHGQTGAGDSGVDPLPLCQDPPLPSPRVNFFMNVPSGPATFKGSASVQSVRTSASGFVYSVVIGPLGSDATLELGSSGEVFPNFQVGQVVQVNLVANLVDTVVTQLFAVVSDESERVLLAEYNWNDTYLRDGTVRELLDVDLALTETCQFASSCSKAPQRALAASLVTESRNVRLEQEVPVDVTIRDESYALVWRGGLDAGSNDEFTGECVHFIPGPSMDFILVRLPGDE